MVPFDRNWYNRPGVDHVMGFCPELEYHDGLHADALGGPRAQPPATAYSRPPLEDETYPKGRSAHV